MRPGFAQGDFDHKHAAVAQVMSGHRDVFRLNVVKRGLD
jgi:hypothetical protein